MCTFAHGETELRTKNENTFLVGNNNQMNNNNNYNYSNSQQPQMFVNPNNYMNFNPYMQNVNEWSSGEYNPFQAYPFSGPMGNENMMINPNNINLNMNPMMPMNMSGNFGGNISGNSINDLTKGGNLGMSNENYMQNIQK